MPRQLDMVDSFVDGAHALASFPKAGSVVLKDRAGKVIRRDDKNAAAVASSVVGPFRARFVPGGATETVEVTAYAPPFPGPYPQDIPKMNRVPFTPVQMEAIRSGLNKGLTMVVGPPGTGKTDVAVQIISNLYHNFPGQRTLLVTHSNQVRRGIHFCCRAGGGASLPCDRRERSSSILIFWFCFLCVFWCICSGACRLTAQALNDLFEKIMERDVESRHLLRLGAGADDLHTDDDYSKWGRVNMTLSRRLELLGEVLKLHYYLFVIKKYFFAREGVCCLVHAGGGASWCDQALCVVVGGGVLHGLTFMSFFFRGRAVAIATYSDRWTDLHKVLTSTRELPVQLGTPVNQLSTSNCTTWWPASNNSSRPLPRAHVSLEMCSNTSRSRSSLPRPRSSRC